MFEVGTALESRLISFCLQVIKYGVATSHNSLPLFCSGGRVNVW